MRNKTIKYFGALIVTLFFASCNKFLDTRPRDLVDIDNYYQTEEELDYALAATYSKLGEAPLYADKIFTSGFDADDGYVHVSTRFVGASVYNVYPTDPDVTNFWRVCYEGIYRANLLLANVHKATGVSDANRNAIEGEALFLRAYYYFLLVSNFGGVPLITEPLHDTHNTAIPQNTAVEVYTQIVADMEAAEGKVRPIRQIGHGGRISKSAVRGILARVNLHWAGHPINDESRYAEAKKWAEMVINDQDAAHALNPDYRQVFINYSSDQYDIGESIWEIEFWGNTQGVYREAGQVGYFNGIRYFRTDATDPEHGFSYGRLFATFALWNKYEDREMQTSRDFRRNFAIAPFSLAGNPARESPKPFTISGIYNRNAGKYRRYYEVVLPKENVYTPINFPVLRFSDVLLMYAEADLKSTGIVTHEAIDAVNLVRSRGYGKLLTGLYVRSITVNSAGSGYAQGTTNVTISGGGGQGATAAATITNSRVESITVTFEGSGFTGVPTVTISGVGSGATATAVLNDPAVDSDVPVSASASPEAFLTFIQDERSRELCFESLRKGDLVRWGKLVENMKIVRNHIADNTLDATLDYIIRPYENVSARDVVWPIPSYEMGLNSALVQNNGW